MPLLAAMYGFSLHAGTVREARAVRVFPLLKRFGFSAFQTLFPARLAVNGAFGFAH